LQQILLIRVEELPLVEGMAEVSFAMLLTICDELEPVPHDFAELHEAPPSIEHLRLQVVICTIPMFHASDASG